MSMVLRHPAVRVSGWQLRHGPAVPVPVARVLQRVSTKAEAAEILQIPNTKRFFGNLRYSYLIDKSSK
jgi:hypothetical protein